MTLGLSNCSSVRKVRTSSKQNLICKPFWVFVFLTIGNHSLVSVTKVEFLQLNLSYVKAALDHSDDEIVLFIMFCSVPS